MSWAVGDRVKSNPANAHLFEGTGFASKLSVERGGTVVTVPWAAEHHGEGTLLIEWDALRKSKADPESNRQWVHSSLIERVGHA